MLLSPAADTASENKLSKHNLHMKTIRLLIAALLAASAITANAGPAGWPPPYQDRRVKSKAEAEDCCKPDAKVALACKDCKTSNEKPGTDKKGILSWFEADSMHDCAGCKGKITVRQLAGGKVNDVQYTHVCSKCSADSAFTCSTHAK